MLHEDNCWASGMDPCLSPFKRFSLQTFGQVIVNICVSAGKDTVGLSLLTPALYGSRYWDYQFFLSASDGNTLNTLSVRTSFCLLSIVVVLLSSGSRNTIKAVQLSRFNNEAEKQDTFVT